MDLGSDTPDPEIYPNGIKLQHEDTPTLNASVPDRLYIATCGWCDVWGDRPFRATDKNKQKVIELWKNHARIFHPARLDPKFNARTVG